MAEKQHMSVVICGHVDSGKSTTTGRLLFELGGIPEREMEKLKEKVNDPPFPRAGTTVQRERTGRAEGRQLASLARACRDHGWTPHRVTARHAGVVRRPPQPRSP